MRNIIETVIAIPNEFTGCIRIVINDYEDMIVIRNWLMLNLLCKNGMDAIEVVLHLWYSSW